MLLNANHHWANHHWRVLVTRPNDNAKRTRDTLAAKGYDVLHAPMLEIVPVLGTKPQLLAALSNAPQALLVTSGNAVRILAGMTDERTIPLITVGNSTASLARAFGFLNVSSAAGNAKALIKHVAEQCVPERGTLVHLCGSETIGDVCGNLTQLGFTVQQLPLYHAKAADDFPRELEAALLGCELDVALFYSPRSAGIFETIARSKKIAYLLRYVTALCISPSVILEASWKGIHYAEAPHETALIQLLEKITSATLPPREPQ